MGVEQDRSLPGGLLEGLGQVAHHLLGVLVELGVMLHDEEAVVVLLQNSHELKGGKGPAHVQLGDVPVQPAEDAGVVAADEEDLIALQFKVAIVGAPARTLKKTRLVASNTIGWDSSLHIYIKIKEIVSL